MREVSPDRLTRAFAPALFIIPFRAPGPEESRRGSFTQGQIRSLPRKLASRHFAFSFMICASEGQAAVVRWVGFPFLMIPIGMGRQKVDLIP